jgi:hypothetical protein
MTTVYGRTQFGQLLYDLAFTNLEENYLARKHGKPVAKIRALRATREIKGLRQKNGLKNGPESRR